MLDVRSRALLAALAAVARSGHTALTALALRPSDAANHLYAVAADDEAFLSELQRCGLLAAPSPVRTLTVHPPPVVLKPRRYDVFCAVTLLLFAHRCAAVRVWWLAATAAREWRAG